MKLPLGYSCKIKISFIFFILLQLFLYQTDAIGQTPLAETGMRYLDTTAQKKESSWKNSLMMSVGYGGTAVSNWSNGSTPNHNFNMNIWLNTTYNNKKRIQFTSQTMFVLGYNNGGDKVWKKNKDLFYSDNFFLFSMNKKTKNWYFAGILDISTQVFDGYFYDQKAPGGKIKSSSFLSPGFVNEGVGVLYINKIMYIGAAPVAFNHTFVIDKEVKEVLHNKKIDRFTSDFGWEIKVGFYHYLFKNKVFVKVMSSYFHDYNSRDDIWTSNGFLRVKLTKWLSFNTDYSLMYNNKQHSISLVSDNTSGIPTDITTGASKLQTLISYGLGVNLRL